eukprot:6989140-Prymnesium_polylepis.1
MAVEHDGHLDRLARTASRGHEARARAGALLGVVGFALMMAGITLSVVAVTEQEVARIVCSVLSSCTFVPGTMVLALSNLPSDVRKVRTLIQNLRALLIVIAVGSIVFAIVMAHGGGWDITLRCG